MENNFDLSIYLSNGIENIISGAIKASIKNPKETAFMMKFLISSRTAKHKRDTLEKNGQHIPPFLIASISETCNLFCKGCYARQFQSCGNAEQDNQMSDAKWDDIFAEAEKLGISFILLAGGEPLMRRKVIEKAAKHRNIIFPIFTNGTLITNEYIQLLNDNRNLIPVLSIEGNETQTNDRRGNGTYKKLMEAMDELTSKGILYGSSITVTTENIKTVTSTAFIDILYSKGCKIVFFIEYVPVNPSTKHLAPTDAERDYLEHEQSQLRKQYEDIIFISFPGDEKSMGGCLAAGRGFFHINSNGGAEPCPFSPYSDINLKESTLLEALNSQLFKKIIETEMSQGSHDGGCLLFEKEQKVQQLLADS